MSRSDHQLRSAQKLQRNHARLFVSQVRRKTGLTVDDFAARFRADPRRLQAWEAGTEIPPSHALAYLKVIAKNAKAVEEALG